MLSLFTIICLGVYQLHNDSDIPLVHRDLKPANILVDKVGTMKTLKITDFGISKRDNQREITTMRAAMSHLYAPLEQIEKKAASTKFDMWALGVILY